MAAGDTTLQVSFMRQANIATAVPVPIIGFGTRQKLQAFQKVQTLRGDFTSRLYGL
jgi:hypothetical protein